MDINYVNWNKIGLKDKMYDLILNKNIIQIHLVQETCVLHAIPFKAA